MKPLESPFSTQADEKLGERRPIQNRLDEQSVRESLPVIDPPEISPSSTRVLAIANQKGGVAKTTTAVSLGGALALRQKEVLLVDLDAQANLTLALGRDPQKVRGAITDVLFHSATLLSVSRQTAIPGLDLVPANAGLELAERFLPVRKDYELILQRTLQEELHVGQNKRASPANQTEELRDSQPAKPAFEGLSGPSSYKNYAKNMPVIEYDFVILDCPPFLGAVTLNAMVAADLLIIPTQAEYFSAFALRTMMTSLRQVRSEYNPDLAYRILITLFDRRNRIHRQVGEQIYKTFGEGVFQNMIEIDTKLRESAIQGLPITHHKAQSRSALQYDALAQEIIQYVR